jgi:hypothetical protein
MKSSWIWIISITITLGSALFQRVTGPSYPVRGKTRLGGARIDYRLPRSASTGGDADVRVAAPAPIAGTLGWKRFGTQDRWAYVEMRREGGELVGSLPRQPPMGKVMYRVILRLDFVRVSLHGAPVVLRFRGDVPTWILAPHIVLMFLAMLFSTRLGLELLSAAPSFGKLVGWTVMTLTAGGMILGPVVQKLAFGAPWTGWPLGTDLTDNKTAVVWVLWLIVWWRQRAGRGLKWWVLAASALTLVVYLIPHSLFGSELKYNS